MRRKNKIRHCQVEVLLNNHVDKDIQKMVLPLNLMQNIFSCPKYIIRDNFILPPNTILNLIPVLRIIFSSIILFIQAYLIFMVDSILDEFAYVCIVFVYNFIFHTTGFIVNFIYNVRNGIRHIDFVLKLQDAHRTLPDKREFKKFIKSNWLNVVFHVGLTFGLSSWMSGDQVFAFVASIILITFDVDMICAIRIIKLLKMKLTLWNIQALKKDYDISEEEFGKKMFKAYVDIMECYRIFISSVKFLIFYQAIDLFSHMVLYLQSWILLIKFANKYHLDLKTEIDKIGFSFTMWVLKMWLLETTLSVALEKFYITVENSSDTCALLLLRTSENTRRLSKNVKRVIRSNFSKFRPYGAFTVDAKLPIHMAVLISYYAVVLLQFAFVN